MLVGTTETQTMDTMAGSTRAPRIRSERCSGSGPSHGSLICATTNGNRIDDDDDHVAPIHPKNVSKPSSSSFAGQPGTRLSMGRPLSRRGSTTPQTAQLQMVEEHEEISSPLSSASSITTQSDDSDQITALPRLTKRVSFSEAAPNVLLAPSSPLSLTATTDSTRSVWHGFFRPIASRPPPVKQVYVPPARGQTAGRSILKRTSSYSDHSMRELTDVHADEKIEITPLTACKRKTAKDENVETSREEFVDVDLTERSSMSSTTSTVTARPGLVRSRISYEQRAVRHWSIVGSNWMRRSGLCAGG